ncbi:uncharacterized protein [Coffea arabica]|uniref:Uncharacterized protein n=1 Tax=Coffea arabica TaxID=13443 RepID=A0ABM4WKI9_COFAR
MTLDTGLVFCMCDRDCEMIVNTLPPHRVAEVFLGVLSQGCPQVAAPCSTGPKIEPETADKQAKGLDVEPESIEVAPKTADKHAKGADVEPKSEEFYSVAAEDETEYEDVNSKATETENLVEKKADNRSDAAKEQKDVEGCDEASNAQVREEDDQSKHCNKNTQNTASNEGGVGKIECDAARQEEEENGVNVDEKMADSDYEDQGGDNDILDEAIKIGQTFGGDLGAYSAGPSHCNKSGLSHCSEQRKKKVGRKGDPPIEINCCDDSDMINIDDIESEYDSDDSFELKSQNESDEDGNSKIRRPKFPVFNEQTDMKKSKFEVGQKFTSVIIFRLAVRI